MANIKISQLPGSSTVSSTDLIPFVAVPGYTTQQAPISAVANLVLTGTAAAAVVANTVTAAVQSNITTIGNGSSAVTIALNAGNTRISGNANVVGNLTVGNLSLLNQLSAISFVGDGGNLSNIQAANVVGQVANAYNATFITSNTQPNLTVAANLIQVGSLANLTVLNAVNIGGNLTAVDADLGNAATANFFVGSGATLFDIPGSNVVGSVPNATMANIADTAGTVTINAQPNITSVGTLNSLNVAGSSNLSGLVIGPITAVPNVTATITHTADIIIGGTTYKLMLSQ